MAESVDEYLKNVAVDQLYLICPECIGENLQVTVDKNYQFCNDCGWKQGLFSPKREVNPRGLSR